MKNKILFVDDDLNVRETITELLVYKDYDVRTASNGQVALEVLEYWIPDLILCDIIMPIMDGNVLHDIIKDNHSLSSIPFIFLSAKSENFLMRKCLLDGADDFLSKPFEIDELLKVIKTKIERFEKIKMAHNNLFSGNKKSFLHEINTPLNGILGFTNVLINNEVNLEDSEIQEVYECLKISAERLNRTMQNIIIYQNLKNNKLEFRVTSNSEILKIFLNVKEKLLHNYKNQKTRISFEVDTASIKINENYLHFILFELIDNAFKFSGNGKKIVIRGKCHSDEYYELIIKDFGIGFSEDELKKIGAGQQFNREQNEQQGLGLGLFLCKFIIKHTKGVFSIVSNINKGTSIKLFLPVNN
ncbi:ATP-binding response regulator [Flavobacterium cellulosilyticum]|uniref:histidine kinase n=1 Tax=Flavobacterium cellulosilyticum TaxID=2541731 RepID=A0A4R5C5W5_9FLAO|nr:HAMP domain-containing sensor histidine kinase [Flavobacterium cellulosilyticum]TDD95058.1 hybrid sensor histidine kinase/response regulator [Flavobacterium cellulosilyticum]